MPLNISSWIINGMRLNKESARCVEDVLVESCLKMRLRFQCQYALYRLIINAVYRPIQKEHIAKGWTPTRLLYSTGRLCPKCAQKQLQDLTRRRDPQTPHPL